MCFQAMKLMIERWTSELNYSNQFLATIMFIIYALPEQDNVVIDKHYVQLIDFWTISQFYVADAIDQFYVASVIGQFYVASAISWFYVASANQLVLCSKCY